MCDDSPDNPRPRLDLTSDPDGQADAVNSGDGSRGQGSHGQGRRFVGIHFACCDAYARVYINRDQTAYEGRCPRCLRLVRLAIGPGGTDARFFTAY